MDQTRNYFNEIAEDYDSSADGKFVRRMYGEVIIQIMEAGPEILLDLGCGNGNVLLAVGRRRPVRLYGLDLSENMIVEAGKRLAALDGDWNLQVGDAVSLPYEDRTFDTVACNASFHHYTDPGRVLKEIRRVLKPGGTLVLGDPTAPFFLRPLLNLSFSGRKSGDHHLYGKREIIGLLREAGFSVKRWKTIDFQAFILTAERI